MLHPADIYVLLGLLARHEEPWTYRRLADELGVPHALVQRALERSEEAGLYVADRRMVHRTNVEEFLVHGVRFVAPAKMGGIVSGVPAAWSAPPMSNLTGESGELPAVWPSAHGYRDGQALRPLHKAAVGAVEGWPRLGEFLSIVDSLRAGDGRVRSVAADRLGLELRARPSRR